MKKFTVFLAGLSVVVLVSILTVYLSQTLPFFRGVKLASPELINSKSLGLNQWFPRGDVLLSDTNPRITANSALFVETKTGKILYDKNSQERLPIASLVKVMTALVALEHLNLEDQLIVSERAVSMEPDKMLLIAGEKLTVKELLYGVFLVSANDAAEVIAEGATGRREEFIELMNSKAKQLGMKNSLFVNPTGLDEDSGNSYASAYDMAILSRHLIKHFPQVVEISKTEHIILPQTLDHQDYEMYSGINLLTTYPGVVGLKTGYTPQSGLTLITLARKNGHEILGVLLGSENRREEARELLDYSFNQLK